MARRPAPGRTKNNAAGAARISVSFDAHDYAAIKGIAKRNRVSAAWVVREAVSNYLNDRAPLFARERQRTHD